MEKRRATSEEARLPAQSSADCWVEEREQSSAGCWGRAAARATSITEVSETMIATSATAAIEITITGELIATIGSTATMVIAGLITATEMAIETIDLAGIATETTIAEASIAELYAGTEFASGKIMLVNNTDYPGISSPSKLLRLISPLMTLAFCVAVSSAAIASSKPQTSAPQKRRVIQLGHFSVGRELQRIITWQTSNTSGSNLPYETAHLAIETVDPHPRILWQADGDSEYLVDSIRVVDLDGDGVPEIISLWWKGASQGAVPRVFHWERAARSFVELKFQDECNGVHSIKVVRNAGSTNRLEVFVPSESGRTRRIALCGEYELRDAMFVRSRGGDSVAQIESGIEGQAIISPARPGPIRQGESGSAPYKTTLAIRSVTGDSEIKRLETGSDGRFRVVLPPGTYRIGPAARAGRFPRGDEQTVTVIQGKFAHVTIEFDSGMR